MDILDDDIISLWKSLNQNNVQYIMVGGFASVLYGVNRITHDVDIWIKDTLDNRKKIRATLKELGYGDFEELESVQIVAGFSTIYLKAGIELDLMTSLKAFTQQDFDECFEKATIAEIENVQVRFLHINQLLTEKETNSRKKDLADVEELIEIIKLQSNS